MKHLPTSLALVTCFIAHGSSFAEAESRIPLVLKLGYTSFETPRDVEQVDDKLTRLAPFLNQISDKSTQDVLFLRRLDFDVFVGNYYQTLDWMRQGKLDAAILSPFAGYLLATSGRGKEVVELAEAAPRCKGEFGDWTHQGQRPVIAAVEDGLPSPRPIKLFEAFLSQVRDQAESGNASNDWPSVRMVSHLSTSGFVAPVLYAHDWLERDGHAASGAVKRRFWELFFEHVSFAQSHTRKLSQDELEHRVLLFSYSGRTDLTLKGPADQTILTATDWWSYDDTSAWIPNDLLVVRAEVEKEVFWGLGEQPDYASVTKLSLGESDYTRVLPFNKDVHAKFRARVEKAFRYDPYLGPYFSRWYEHGDYDFALSDTLGFLKTARALGSSRFAVVLPGGGVKSAYQAVLLDHLFGTGSARAEPLLVNRYAEAPDSPRVHPEVEDGPLEVAHIAGTSGGALTALLAAQLQVHDPRTLTKVWIGDDAVQVQAGRIFPAMGVLRWISFFVLFVILMAIFHVWIVNSRGTRVAPDADPRTVSAAALLTVIAVLCLSPYVVRIAAGDERAVPPGSGWLFGLTVATLFSIFVCARPIPEGFPRRSWLFELSLLLVGIATCMVSMAAGNQGTPWAMRTLGQGWPPSGAVIGGLGLLVTVCGVALAAHRGRFGFTLLNRRAYCLMVALIAVYFGLSYGMLFVLNVFLDGTAFEMTTVFWKLLLLSGLAAAVAFTLVLAALARNGNLMAGGMGLLFGELHIAWLPGKPRGWVLLKSDPRRVGFVLFGTSILWWNYVLAPGLYDGSKALGFTRAALGEFVRGNKARENIELLTPLLVTGSVLKGGCDGPEHIPEGEIYFCSPAKGNTCGVLRGDRWHRVDAGRPDDTPLIDVVFASGSPFPVFPPHSLRFANGAVVSNSAQVPCRVDIVDGGLAHNVPVEAVELADADYALIVSSTPRATVVEPSWWERYVPEPGRLVRFAGRLFPFLFDRSQESDTLASSNLFVASLAPHPGHRSFPFLTDFRPKIVREMHDHARDDLKDGRRIGRIESWGSPRFVKLRVRSGVADARKESFVLGQGWDSHIQRAFDKFLGDEGNRGAAVFDFDDTCIRKDIGDAVFYELVRSLDYRGDREDFWQLFADVGTAQAKIDQLRGYWKAHHGQPQPELDDLSSWPEDFRSYFVRFIQEYHRILNDPANQGPGRGYAWVVQLLVGKTEAQVRAMTERVWQRETGTPVRMVSVSAAQNDPLQIQRGIRIYKQMADLIADLKRRSWRVWVVSASSEYSVRYAAEQLGVDADHVRGMTLESEGGEFTSTIRRRTYGPGKAQVLADEGIVPAVVVGDSRTDLDMLRMAKRIQIVIDHGKLTDTEIGRAFRQDPSSFTEVSSLGESGAAR